MSEYEVGDRVLLMGTVVRAYPDRRIIHVEITTEPVGTVSRIMGLPIEAPALVGKACDEVAA